AIFVVKPKSVIRPPRLHSSLKILLADRFRPFVGIFSVGFPRRSPPRLRQSRQTICLTSEQNQNGL
ncbi:hypothetical protein, partial [Bacteroides heparinolyticus]|uniref:hypothetical protein n=1 Tax=Prevotella heparinolytica TaxID=28113 RepID=UPI0035A1B10D